MLTGSHVNYVSVNIFMLCINDYYSIKISSLSLLPRSSSEDSEDNNDPYLWQQERQKYKTNLTGLTTTATQERVKKPSSQPSIKPPSGKSSVSTRQRQSSSGSFSEDDVFEHLTGVPELSSHSEREDESSPKASQKQKSGKPSKKSKKKKRRGRGQKRSGSGSDSESKGSTQHEDSISEVKTMENVHVHVY